MKTRDKTGRFTYCGEVITRRGYPMLYLPNHHRAKANGYVFEHIVIAERELGRELLDNEVVHHIDGDKTNNHPSNLEVFANNAEHIKGHWNTRSKKFLYKGQLMTIPEMAMLTGIPYNRIYQRIYRLGWSVERATSS